MNEKADNVYAILYQFLISPVWYIAAQLLLNKNGFIPPLLPTTHIATHYCFDFCQKPATGISVTLGHPNLGLNLHFKVMAKYNTGKLSLQPFYQGILCSRYLECCVRGIWKYVKVLINQLKFPKFEMMGIEWKRKKEKNTGINRKEFKGFWTRPKVNSTICPALKVTSQNFLLFCVCSYCGTNIPGFKKAAASDLAGNEEKGNWKLNCFNYHILWYMDSNNTLSFCGVFCVWSSKSLFINKAICLFWTIVALI